MTRQGHQLTGVALGIVAVNVYAHLAPPHGGWQTVLGCALVAWAAFMGSTAPDALEIAWFRHGARHSLIPHRTFTHWPALWITAICADVFWVLPHQGLMLAAALGAYCAGAVLHLFMDAGTPMGIPLVLPTRRHRRSLNLYRSGQAGAETALVLICFGLSLLSIAWRP